MDIEDLKSFVGNKTLGINSLSYVLLNQTVSYGPIYYIHTVDAMRALDTTVFKDQLLQRLDRHQARELRALWNRVRSLCVKTLAVGVCRRHAVRVFGSISNSFSGQNSFAISIFDVSDSAKIVIAQGS